MRQDTNYIIQSAKMDSTSNTRVVKRKCRKSLRCNYHVTPQYRITGLVATQQSKHAFRVYALLDTIVIAMMSNARQVMEVILSRICHMPLPGRLELVWRLLYCIGAQ